MKPVYMQALARSAERQYRPLIHHVERRQKSPQNCVGDLRRYDADFPYRPYSYLPTWDWNLAAARRIGVSQRQAFRFAASINDQQMQFVRGRESDPNPSQACAACMRRYEWVYLMSLKNAPSALGHCWWLTGLCPDSPAGDLHHRPITSPVSAERSRDYLHFHSSLLYVDFLAPKYFPLGYHGIPTRDILSQAQQACAEQ